MDIAKTVKKYGKIYRRILVIGNYSETYGNVCLRKI